MYGPSTTVDVKAYIIILATKLGLCLTPSDPTIFYPIEFFFFIIYFGFSKTNNQKSCQTAGLFIISPVI